MLRSFFLNSPLRHPALRRLWLGLVCSRIGDQLTLVSLLWFMLELTGSGTALGVVILCFSLPGLISSPLIGRWLDRIAPQQVIVADNLLRAVAIGAIPLLYWANLLEPWMIYGLACLAGALAPGTEVGLRVLLPALVEDAELEEANAWLSSSDQIGYLIGPVLAGILVAQIGAPPVLLLDTATFIAMTLLVGPIAEGRSFQPMQVEQTAGSGLGAMLRKVWALKKCMALIALSFWFNLAYGPLEPALPLYSYQALGTGVAGYGILWSGFGAGALIGLLATRYLGRYQHPGLVCVAIPALWGLLLLPLVFSTSLPPALLFFALAGAVWAPYIPIETSTLQRITPPGLHGQVFGVRWAVLLLSVPLGVLSGGLLLDQIPATAVIGLSALACLLAGIIGALSPMVRTLGPLTDDRPLTTDH
jgi:predicted MFS family arabinose efflux permease